MAWRRLGDKPLSESMMFTLLMHICVTRPQWVNGAKRRTSSKLWITTGPLSRESTFDTTRADSSCAPSQWETALLCNDVSHWLGTSLESALSTLHTKRQHSAMWKVFPCQTIIMVNECADHAAQLTHWSWDKMAAIFQTTISNAFSWMKMYELPLIFHCS